MRESGTGNRLNGWVIFTLVPLMFMSVVLGFAGAKPAAASLRGAIVNLDDHNSQAVGRQVAAKFASDPGSALTWSEVSEAEAERGLADGTFVAAVVIPPTFSDDIRELGSDPAAGQRANVDVALSSAHQSNQVSIGYDVARVLNDTVSQRLTDTGNVLVEFNSVRDSIDSVASDVQRLALANGDALANVNRSVREAARLANDSREVTDNALELAQTYRDSALRVAEAADVARAAQDDAQDHASDVKHVTDQMADASRDAQSMAEKGRDVQGDLDQVNAQVQQATADTLSSSKEGAAALSSARDMSSSLQEANEQVDSVAESFDSAAADLSDYLEVVDDMIRNPETLASPEPTAPTPSNPGPSSTSDPQPVPSEPTATPTPTTPAPAPFPSRLPEPWKEPITAVADKMRDLSSEILASTQIMQAHDALQAGQTNLKDVLKSLNAMRNRLASDTPATCEQGWSDDFCAGYRQGVADANAATLKEIDAVIARLATLQDSNDKINARLRDVAKEHRGISRNIRLLADDVQALTTMTLEPPVPSVDPSVATLEESAEPTSTAPPQPKVTSTDTEPSIQPGESPAVLEVSADSGKQSVVVQQASELRSQLAKSQDSIRTLTAMLSELQRNSDGVLRAVAKSQQGAGRSAASMATLSRGLGSFSGDVTALARQLDQLSFAGAQTASAAMGVDARAGRVAAQAHVVSQLVAQAANAQSPDGGQTLARALAASHNRVAAVGHAVQASNANSTQAAQAATNLSQAIDAGIVKMTEMLSPEHSGEIAQALRSPVVVDKVALGNGRVDVASGHRTTSATAWLLALTLGIVAMGSVLAPRPQRSDAAPSGSPVSRWAHAAAPLAGVGALVGAAGAALAGVFGFVDGASVAPLVGVLTLAGATTAVVSQALATWLGRAAAVVVAGWATLGVAELMLDGPLGQPWEVLQLLSPLSVTAHAADAVTGVASLTGPMLGLLVWLAVGVAFGVLATWARPEAAR